jgi:capsule polysaccharide export protein KpsE/RkpR
MQDCREPAATAKADLQAMRPLFNDDSTFDTFSTTMMEWTKKFADKQIEQFMQDNQKQLGRNSELLQQAELQLHKVKSDMRNDKQEISELKKKTKSLEKEVERLKSAVKCIGAYDGVAKPGAPLRKVIKAYKRAHRS